MTRIIHSLWTWPSQQQGKRKLSGSWLSPRYHYMSWAYSCLQFKQFYEQVELYTDDWGKHLLIDLLQLPYSRVHTTLQEVTAPHPSLWAWGKLAVFAQQEEPFIHADGDVFIFNHLGEDFGQAALLAQHLEDDYPYYKNIIPKLRSVFEHYPQAMTEAWAAEPHKYQAYNAGLIGGKELSFFREFVQEAQQLILANEAHLATLPVHELNIVFEQHLYYCLARQKGLPVRCYKHAIPGNHAGLTKLEGAPGRRDYVHPVAVFKQDRTFCRDLESRLQRHYPEYYYRIQHLIGQYAL